MCEPAHSILQFPAEQFGGPSESRLAMLINSEFADGFQLQDSKRIGGWLHFSRFGSGHSETIRKITQDTGIPYGQMVTASSGVFYIPYEAHWHNRTITLDGAFPNFHKIIKEEMERAHLREFGNSRTEIMAHKLTGKNREGEIMRKVDDYNPVIDYIKKEALEMATEYANRVSIGNIKQVSRFLSDSIRYSDRPYVYTSMFRDMMLSDTGRKFLDSVSIDLIGKPWISVTRGSDFTDIPNTIEAINKTLSVRKNLVSEWADDPKAWECLSA